MDVYNQMTNQNSMPPGPPGLGGPPISPHLLEQQHNFPSFHAPSDTGRPPPPSDVGRGRWNPNDDPFLLRDRSGQPGGQFHRGDYPDNARREYGDPHGLPPPPLEARNDVFHCEENPSRWRDRQLEYHGRSAEREYSGDRERRGRAGGYDVYGTSHHRSRARSPPTSDKSVKERLGPTPMSEGRLGHHHHHRSIPERELGRAIPDVEIIEHRSRPPSALSQSRVRHSPPPIHHPEHRPRLSEDSFNSPYTVNERLGPPLPHPLPAPTQQPVPLFGPLAERLGGSPDATARSVQARLGPPRITEPLDNNQGLVSFNAAGPTPLLSRSENRSPLPDLRQELDNFNPMSRSMQSPQHLSSSSSGAVPLFRHSRSPSRRVLSPVRGPGSTSPTRRAPLSPKRVPFVSGRQSHTPSPRSHPPSSPKHPPLPTGRPPSPPKRPPSPLPSKQHSSSTKAPQSRSTSPKRHSSSRPISPVIHTVRCAQQSPTSKPSKSPTRRDEKTGEAEQSRSRRSSKLFSPPLSPSSTMIKKHTSNSVGSSGSGQQSRSSPPPSSSSSSKNSRRSSWRIKSPPPDSGTKYFNNTQIYYRLYTISTFT